MINDRFGAQLRQHLVETADERAADGQLATIIDLVADTPQRRMIAARVTWFPRRLSLFPSPALRYALVLLTLVLALVAAGMLGAGTRRPSTVFEGTWTSIDPGDGSTQLLVVGQGTTPTVRYVDQLASGDACRDDTEKVFTADGAGTVDGDHLDVSFPDGGGCGSTTVELGPAAYTYDAATDTLADDQPAAVTWTRAQSAVVPSLEPVSDPPPSATLAPTPESTPQSTPGENPDCRNLASGSTYTATVGDVALTASIPVEPVGRWSGWRDTFALTSSCTRGLQVSINAEVIAPGTVTSCSGTAETVATFEDAVSVLAGSGIAPIRLRIDGRDAARFDVTNLAHCAGGLGLQSGVILGGGESGSIYVVDVDGAILSFELNTTVGATQEQLDEARAIVAGLRLAGVGPSLEPAAS